jgi:hypothetical protein
MKSRIHILLEHIFYTLLTIPKIAILSKNIASKNIRSLKIGKELIILGNGPSLKEQVKTIKDLTRHDKMCVNHFAESEQYADVKPQFYVLNAPEMWLENVDEIHKEKGKKLFKAISENTQWPLQLFIPVGAKNVGHWQKDIIANKNISVNYFNTVPLEGSVSFIEWAMSRGWGMPRPHNVLIPSIILSMRMNYDTVYLVGADHSWLPEIYVSDKNVVYLTQKHFYDEEHASARPMDKLGKGSRKLHEVLEKFTYAFSCYFLLNDYATKHNITILNATKGSFIDAFKRISTLPKP